MKLRVRGNSVRLRLTKTEVADLARLGAIEETAQVGPAAGALFRYRIELDEAAPAPSSQLEGAKIIIILPAPLARAWALGDGEVGIYSETAWGLKLAIEKDFQCLTPRQGEDDTDAFEHPGGQTHSECSIEDE
jgi:hypothetical protein